MGEIPHSEKMFHLPIEVSVYVPSTQDVDKVVSKSEMKLRVDEVKKYLATLFGGFSSSSVEGGFLASDGKVVKENVERVVSFAPKGEFEKNKEALVQKASEWATKWGQEAIGLEHEGDLYYVPQKFENGGTIAIREAKEMANSQALEIKHHASELANALKGNPTIEAWVIAKLERASNDLADVTHYLEGRVQMSGKKMADGGGIQTFKQKQLAELKIWKKSKLEDLKSVSKSIGITSNNNSYLSSLERLDKLVDACEKVIKSGILKEGKYFYIKEFIVDSYRGNLQTQASLRFDKFLITEDKNFEKDWAEQKQKFPYADMNSFIAQKVGELTKKILGYSISSSISYSIASSSIGGNFANGGSIDFDSDDYTLVLYHEEKGNWFIPKGTVYYWLYEDKDAGKKLRNEEYDYVFYPQTSMTLAFQEGYIPPIKRIWTPKFQKQNRGSEKLLGVVQGYINDKGDKLVIEMMSTNPKKQKRGVMSNIIKELRQQFNLSQEQVEFKDLTKEGERFVGKKKYANGGSIEPNSKEVQFIKYRDEEIMYDPIFQEFFVNDVMFKTLQEARAFIDKGAPMSDEIKDAYRRGLFKKGGNMKFERPSYKSNYVASQAQQAQAQADANLIADENWNMDYKNDPLLKKKKEAQELGIRAGLAYATRGQSEIVRFQNQAKQQAKQQQATKEQAPEMQETTSTENSAFPEHEVQPELAKMIENNPQMVQMLSGLGGLKGV